MIQMLDANTICKEGDIGLMIVITLNIRFRTSSTRTSGVCILAPLVVRKERMQYHLHITRGNDMIDIESYGQLTLSPIASDIHKTIGLPPQLNVTVRPTTCMEYIAVAQTSCLSNTKFHFTTRCNNLTMMGLQRLFDILKLVVDVKM